MKKNFLLLLCSFSFLVFGFIGCVPLDNSSNDTQYPETKTIENKVNLPAPSSTPKTNPSTKTNQQPKEAQTTPPKKETETTKNKNNISKKQENPYKIVIQTNKKTLTLYKNGKLIQTYPIAVGKSETPTPKGSFTIVEKSKNPGGAFGVRWMGLSVPGGHYGIHGTNQPDSIGQATSKGCIRMNNADVKKLYSMVQVGTVVEIS